MDDARKSGEYDEFSRARFGFETALEEWPENMRAIEGLKATKYDYAKTALDQGDLDLGLSLLDGSDEDHSKLRTSIQAEIVKRDARQQQIRRLKRVSFGASLVVAIVASVATVWINSERDKALAAQKEEAIQREQAQRSEQEAQEQRLVAVAAREKAVAAQKIAQENEQKAIVAESRAKQEAENALRNFKVAERNAYYSDMLLLQKAWQDSDIANLQVILNRYRRRQDLRGFEWDYWNRMASDGLFSRRKHSDSIYDITFSPDGTRMASASQDKTVQVWDIAAEKLIFTLKGHTASVNSVAFSPDASRLATASSDGLVKVWDAVNGKESGSYKRHINDVYNVKFSPDG
ncbi:MAG: hypothetical protein K0U89_20415, partial [Planctomycetes bacterium]|nr:hypothetical protein [Planctomycetota bacterium]